MTVSVEIDPRWAKIVRSPLYVIVSGLTGVSVTFAPLFLYWSGKGKFFPGYEWLVVPTCFVVIYLVSSFYFVLGSKVARKLREN
jgi:hypothetical protein